MNFIPMLSKALPLLLASSVAMASVPLAPRVGAGGKMDMYGCMQSNEYYIANFAAYQRDPQQPPSEKTLQTALCQEIPSAGATQVTVDLLDRDVRNKPVVLKVLDSTGKVLAETPATVAKQGVITVNADFPRAGNYEAVVYVDDTDMHVAQATSALHIPLSVALVTAGPSASITNLLLIVLGVGGGALGLGKLLPRILKANPAV
ncbi:MAG: hypothetical protein ABL925_16385 [Methylococcales bacterium]